MWAPSTKLVSIFVLVLRFTSSFEEPAAQTNDTELIPPVSLTLTDSPTYKESVIDNDKSVNNKTSYDLVEDNPKCYSYGDVWSQLLSSCIWAKH